MKLNVIMICYMMPCTSEFSVIVDIQLWAVRICVILQIAREMKSAAHVLVLKSLVFLCRDLTVLRRCAGELHSHHT